MACTTAAIKKPQARFDFGCSDHVLALHGKHSSGVVIAQKDQFWVDNYDCPEWHERAAKLREDVLATADVMAGEPDVYMGVNGVIPFKRRGFEHINQLTCNFVDVDFYKLGISKDQAMGAIQEICLEYSIPYPRYLMDSGRGLYAIWLYHKPMYVGKKNQDADKNKAQWVTAQELLIQMFEPVGADPACKDPARVLRLAGTINSKSDSAVTAYDLGEATDFHKLRIKLFKGVMDNRPVPLPTAPFQKKDQGEKKKPATKYYTKQGISSFLNARTLVYARMSDFRKLAELRGGVLHDHREMCIFYFAISAAVYCNTRESLLREVSLFMCSHIHCVGKYDYRKPEKLLASVLKRHEKTRQARIDGDMVTDLNYKARNDTIIRALEITPEEQKHLKTIISKEEKGCRDAKYQESKRRAAGAVPRAEYEAQAQDKAEQARALKAQGMSQRKIAEALGVSRGAVEHYLKK